MRRQTTTVLYRDDPVVGSIERRIVREVSGEGWSIAVQKIQITDSAFL